MAKQQSSEFWSDDLYYLLNTGPAALGLRGTTQSLVSACERGGAVAFSDPEWIRDEQIGMGKTGVNHAARMRAIEPLWRQVSSFHRATLTVHYEHRQLPGGAAAYMLAPDGKASLAAVTLGLCSPDERKRIEKAAGELNGKPESWAHTADGKQRVKTIRALVTRAVEPVRVAHVMWNLLTQDFAQAWIDGKVVAA